MAGGFGDYGQMQMSSAGQYLQNALAQQQQMASQGQREAMARQQVSNLSALGSLAKPLRFATINTPKQEKKTMFKAFREYLSKHSDIVFTVFLVMLADKWFFKGALKGSVQGLASKLIDKAHLKLGE